jgi:hypothetical protein
MMLLFVITKSLFVIYKSTKITKYHGDHNCNICKLYRSILAVIVKII